MNAFTTTTGLARRGVLLAATGAVAILCAATPARAQFNGENLLGDMGVKSGTQPAPGFYVSSIYYRYFTDTLKDPNGDRITLDPTGKASQAIHAGMPVVTFITPKKVLGASLGMMAVLPLASGSLEAPGFGLSEEASTGLSDLYVMPVQLGWHFSRGDAVAGVGLFAPTGRYTAGADDNLGKGMWSYELSAGGTLYFDHGRSWSVSTTAFWETHGAKEGEAYVENVRVSDVKVGQLLTLEGGVGRSFLHGAAHVGVAYYAQWKVTPDEMTLSATGTTSIPPQHRVFGIGPDVTIPIATKSKLVSLVNVRYMWETGTVLKTQGQTLMITNTIPIGGIRIPSKH